MPAAQYPGSYGARKSTRGVVSDEDQILRPQDVAKMFRVDPKTVARWAASGKLPSVRTPGGHYRFRSSEIAKFFVDDAADTAAADDGA